VAARRADPSRSLPRTPARASVRCQGRSLFRPLGSPGGTGGSLSNQRGEQLHEATSCRSNAAETHRRRPRSMRLASGGVLGLAALTETLRYLYATSPLPRLLQFYREYRTMARRSATRKCQFGARVAEVPSSLEPLRSTERHLFRGPCPCPDAIAANPQVPSVVAARQIAAASPRTGGCQGICR